MLPFLKKKQEFSQQDDGGTITRKPDDEHEFDMLDAVAEDFMAALETKDKALLRDALEALCEYLKEEDEEQDEQLIEKDHE